MSVQTIPRSFPGDGNWLNVPRSSSPEHLYHDDEPTSAPGLSSSISSAGRSSSSSSTTSIPSPSLLAPPEPMKKHGRFQSMFKNARAGLKMTPVNNNNETASIRSRRSSRSTAASSVHSHRSISSAFSKLAPWKSSSSSLCDNGELRLADKYGPYLKPAKKSSSKSMGATSKKNIASGATAVIRLVEHQGNVLAVKEFKKRDKSEAVHEYEDRMQNEYCISKKVSGHPNVISTVDLVKDERDRWCAVMEYCSGGDVFSLIQERPSLTEMESACLFKQLLLGLDHLHQLGIAHRDIKPENLVLTENGTLKICDFGTSDMVEDGQPSRKWCGSEPFWSPEMWTLKTEHDGYDGRAVDVWSAAVTYMCIRTHMLPFRAAFYTGRPNGKSPMGAKPGSPADVATRAKDGGDQEYQLYCQQRQQQGPTCCEVWQDLSQKERECLAGMMDPDPSTRFTVKQALDTPWMQSVEMCNDGFLPNGWRHYHCRPSSKNK